MDNKDKAGWGPLVYIHFSFYKMYVESRGNPTPLNI
jgi:hypothetical protein